MVVREPDEHGVLQEPGTMVTEEDVIAMVTPAPGKLRCEGFGCDEEVYAAQGRLYCQDCRRLRRRG